MAACGQLGNENIRARKFVELGDKVGDKVGDKERVQIRVVGAQNAPEVA
jgi:hypothetical protein